MSYFEAATCARLLLQRICILVCPLLPVSHLSATNTVTRASAGSPVNHQIRKRVRCCIRNGRARYVKPLSRSAATARIARFPMKRESREINAIKSVDIFQVCALYDARFLHRLPHPVTYHYRFLLLLLLPSLINAFNRISVHSLHPLRNLVDAQPRAISHATTYRHWI